VPLLSVGSGVNPPPTDELSALAAESGGPCPFGTLLQVSTLAASGSPLLVVLLLSYLHGGSVCDLIVLIRSWTEFRGFVEHDAHGCGEPMLKEP